MSHRSVPRTIHVLREKVEKILARGHEECPEVDKEMAEHVRELQFYHARLEMENESLRKAAHEAERVRDRHTESYDQLPVACLTLDSQGVILDLNSTAADVFGEKRDDLLVKPFSLSLHPDSRDVLDLHLGSVRASGRKGVSELVIQRRDGSALDVRITSVAAQAEGRTLVRSALTEVRDHTRHSGARSGEDRDLVKAVIEASPDAVYVKDLRGRYILCNPKAALMAGRDAARVLGKDDTFLLSSERARRARETDRSVISLGQPMTYEETIDVSKAQRTYLTTKMPLLNDRGELEGIFGVSRDITDFKAIQKNLVDGDTRLRTSLVGTEKLNRDLRHKIEELDTIFNTAPVGIAVSHDPQCLHIKGNATYAGMLGLTPEDNLSKTAPLNERPHNFAEMMDGRQLMPRELPMQVAASKGLAVSNTQIDLVHEDGRLVRILGNTRPLFNEHGRPRGAVGVFIDITELKNTQEDLSKAHRKITKILESITDGFISLDRQWCYTYVNDSACRLLRHTREDLLGRRAFDTFPETSRARFHAEFMRATAANSPTQFEEFLPSLNAWYECRCYPSSQGLSVYFRDVTERKEAEEARRRYVAKLDSLLDVSRDVLAASSSDDMLDRVVNAARSLTGARFAATARGDGDGHFADGKTSEVVDVRQQEQGRLFEEPLGAGPSWNRDVSARSRVSSDHPAWWGVQGLTRPEPIIGAEVHKRGVPEELIMVSGKMEGEFTPEDQAVLSQLAAVASLGLKHIEAKNDVDLLVEERTRELRKAYYSLKTEVQDRKKAEQQLRHAQKMDALGTMAEGIGHDFNNILAAIMGFTQLAYDQLPDDNAERQHLERVLDAGLRGRELVDQMLTFARRGEQERRALQARNVIEETLKLLKPSIPTTIDVRLRLQDTPGFVLGNPAQLQQVIVNLCNNAVYAMRKKGGVLDIELSDLVIDASDVPSGMKAGEYLKLSVGDTGTGIKAEHMDRIFDPFFSTKEGAGAGLGLSVVHGIVGQTGGHITVESRPGQGSRFEVYLPKIAKKRRKAAKETDPVPGGTERILFVDDEGWLVEVGTSLLEGLGYRVTATTSSIEASRIFSSEPDGFDIVLTDQTMPNMTGLELARLVTEARPNVPVVLITGFNYLIDSDEAERSGVSAFAMKPLTKAEIAQVVRNALDNVRVPV